MSKTLATFRIEENDWNAFKRLTDSKGSSASQEIVRYIKSCIDGSDLSSLDNVNTNNLNKRIAQYLDNNLENSIDKCIYDKLDKYLYNFLTRDEAVTSFQLDNRAASIVSDMNNAIAQIQSQIDQLKSQIEQNVSSQDGRKDTKANPNDNPQAKDADKSLTVKEKQQLLRQVKDDPAIAEYLGNAKPIKSFNTADFEQLEKKFPDWLAARTQGEA